MKSKLLAFAVALLSLSVIGVSQLNSGAKTPGQVGDAPRCTIKATKARANAFTIKDNTAHISYTSAGPKNCKAEITITSFYAPTLSGKPWNKQTIHVRNTVVQKGPGNFAWEVALPPKKSTLAKGCFYQVDLSYGDHNILPLIGYGHGKLDCSTPPKPAAACTGLTVTPSATDRTKFQFRASATAKNGAKINGYAFQVFKNGKKIYGKLADKPTLTYTQPQPGAYQVRVVVKSSIGDLPVTANCMKPFTVTKEPTPETPGVKVTKLVEGVKYTRVNVNTEYSYQIAVTNTGNKNLTNVAVTDTPAQGVTLVSAEKGSIAGNKWTYTIPSLKVGETMNFTLKAKVPSYLAGRIINTVCVDTPDVPGTPDDCDTADVDVPDEAKVIVCDPETGKEITVDEKDQDKYVPVGSDECKETQPPVEEKEVPVAEVLPTTGPAEAIAQLFGAASLAGASSYYFLSRRQ